MVINKVLSVAKIIQKRIILFSLIQGKKLRFQLQANIFFIEIYAWMKTSDN